MKIVIQTQVRENYGSADQPYWKCKGGSTFIVPDLTPVQAVKVQEQGIPTLTALIESRNDMFEEYVVGFSVVDNDAVVCDPWETPYELRWIGNRWVANRTVENGEYGYMNSAVERKTEEYDMEMGGGVANYRVVYTMRNGDVITGDQVAEYFKQAA
jgi:hypothetical protein